MIHKPIKPMLLHKADTVPDEDYLYSLKWDGFRCLLSVDNPSNIRLHTRHRNECTYQFPEIVADININCTSAILDGEMVVLDQQGKPCFESVMSRFMTSEKNALSKSRIMPAHYVAFDLLYLNGQSIMHVPLERRIELLQQVLSTTAAASVCSFYDNGHNLFENVKTNHLEGIVSRKKGSKYHLNYRSTDWLKTKNYRYEEVQIAAVRKGKFGWLLQKDNKYLGIMEFVPPQPRKAFHHISKQLIMHDDKDWIYLEPKIKCQVKFQCYTKSGLLRSPSYEQFIL